MKTLQYSLTSLLAALAALVPAVQCLAQTAANTNAPSADTNKPGIVYVTKLDKPKDARRLEEKDFGGYVFVYFKDQTQSAYLAVSRDGYTFYDLNAGKPVFDGTQIAEQKGVRDPHIARGGDGAFYVAMTDLHIFGQRLGYRTNQWERPAERYGWGNNRAIVLLKSWDLIHWTRSDFRVDKAFAEYSDTGCAWAPETIYDEKADKMMVYFTMRMGGQQDCHIYSSYADDAFTKLETTPKMITAIDGIDADITHVGGKYQMFFVADAKIRHAASDKINEGFVAEPQRIDPNKVSTEAPNVFKRLGTSTYVLMYDIYGARPNNMGFSETTDFVNYTNIGAFNEGAMKTVGFDRPKHGAISYLTLDELKNVVKYWSVDMKLD